jgi:hypothetical protein
LKSAPNFYIYFPVIWEAIQAAANVLSLENFEKLIILPKFTFGYGFYNCMFIQGC